MNNCFQFQARRSGGRSAKLFYLVLALGAALANPWSHLLAQSDDFDDGNDAGWTRYNPFAGAGLNIATWGFTNGGYRMRTTAPSPSAQLGAGRAGSVRAEVYTNFYIAVDIVDWDDTLPHAAGILARVQTPGLGTTTGYAFTWDRGNPASPTAGDVDISRITAEAPSGVVVVGADQIHLEPGKSYRFVFIGRDTQLEGRVYELPDTITPKVTIVGNDAAYSFGVPGLVIYDNSTGATNICDITFDNFFATPVEPPRLQMKDVAFGFYEVYWPREASDFVLQSSTVLPGTAADWIDELDIIAADDRYYFIMEASGVFGPKQFFRLVRR
ncbi:MAG TPA: hypothetical protein VNT99_10705 [Methylomirabilota bacterium]|nr:hypothetical protein [Methylomirabilota bacterium]